MMLRRVSEQRKNMDLVDLEEEQEWLKNPEEFKSNQSQGDNEHINQTEHENQNINQSQSDNQNDNQSEDNHDNNLLSNPIKTAAAWGGEGDSLGDSHELSAIYRRCNTDIFDEEFADEQSSEEVEESKTA